MKPPDRRAELVRRGIRHTDIARDLGVTAEAVGRVVRGQQRSARVEAEVAKRMGLTPEVVFGPPGRRQIGKPISSDVAEAG